MCWRRCKESLVSQQPPPSEDGPVEATVSESTPAASTGPSTAEIHPAPDAELKASSDEQAIVREASARVHWLSVVLWLTVMSAVAVAGFFGWQEAVSVQRQLTALQAEAAALAGAVARTEGVEPQLAQLEANLERMRRALDDQKSQQQALVNRIEGVVDQLATASMDTRSESMLSETEMLLRLAEQRLLVERRPETALQLMVAAQTLLGSLQDGRLLPVRQALAADVQALSAVTPVDVLGIQAELLALDPALATLTLPVRRIEQAEVDRASDLTLPGELGGWMDTLSSLIRIRTLDAPIAPLVSAADAGRAREVLRLNLEQLKLALLREDQVLFDRTLEQAMRLTADYFDVFTGSGLRVMQTLEGLQGRSIVVQLPSASSGLLALKAYRSVRLSDSAASAR